MSLAFRRRQLWRDNPSKTYEDEQASSNSSPLPAPANPMPRRGTNNFDPHGRQPPNAGAGAGAGANGGQPNGAGVNPITMAQLSADQPKEKPKQFDYRYDDTDTLMNEISEFYTYVEMPEVVKNADKFKEHCPHRWTDMSPTKRRQYVEQHLELMESAVLDTRRGAQCRLLYLLQGCFAETDGPEEQLLWIIENAKTVRAVDGVSTLVAAFKVAVRRYNRLMDAEERSGASTSGSGGGYVPGEKHDDRADEIQDLLGMLYLIVEVSRNDEDFGEELMAMSPALPMILFSVVGGLRDRMSKGYPIKKLLLLLWKTLLACLGGMREVNKARALSRELAGLKPDDRDNFTKASPIDITSFHRDTSVKYPTFAAQPTTDLPIPSDKLSDGIKPLPPRPNFHSTEIPVHKPADQGLRDPMASTPAPQAPAPLPGTPAPTPPQSPLQKPKKQQYQTDQSKPFVFPYSRSTTAGDPSTSLVPFAIQEADKLYSKHSYVSLGLWQLWQEREECLREERGLGMSGLIGFDRLTLDDDEDEAAMEAMRRDWQYEQEEMEYQERGDKEGVKLAKEKKASARRLHRVEVIYKHTLPIMQSCVIVLLKLLLATVTGPGAPGGAMQAPIPFTSPTTEQPPPAVPPPTKAEVDVARHREVTSKAVSAILLLVLKWFKASHILKFHYVAQLLFDSNCLLLVLKMFGLADVYQSVTLKHDWEDDNFFHYCYLHCAKSPDKSSLNSASQKDASSPRPPATISVNGEDVEIVSDYSWRNFFTSINFLKIMQKMTKHRLHRTYMLHTYKSSQILKRMLRVNHPMLQLQVLKLIKSQMPWCGRKWRQTNMKVITSIYLNCRPELRDEWLAGNDQESELDGALPQEYALRALIQFHNKRNFPGILPTVISPEPQHRRTESTSAVMLEDPALHNHNRHPSSADSDVFPPRSSNAGADMPYNPDGMIEFWLHEYEAVLNEVFGEAEEDGMGMARVGMAERDDPAWNRLDEIMRSGRGGMDEDDISDSESVASVGELGQDARIGVSITPPDMESAEEGRHERELARQQRRQSGNENTWEHMSPTTLSLLPRSPAERRRSSSSDRGSPLRAVSLGSAVTAGELPVFEDEELDIPGPMPISRGPDGDGEGEGEFGAVDEVEYAYGE